MAPAAWGAIGKGEGWVGQSGFDIPALRSFVDLISRPSGLILLTGPTGSGKTTVIYSILNHLLQRHGSTISISISTIEDPVEFRMPTVSQTEVNTARQLTYPVALRSLLRQDPQVIVIGEIRDEETASIAVQAELTGHRVVSTIHAGSTAGVFARLMHMEIEPFLLASGIVGVLGVRLVRTTCPVCAEPYAPDPSLLIHAPAEIAESAAYRRGTGCPACRDTGFGGRALITEQLVVDDSIREAILAKAPTSNLHRLAEAGFLRAARGETTLEELSRVISLRPV